MKAIFFSLFAIAICCCSSISGQTTCKNNDTLVNNLVHLKNYKTSTLGDIPEFKKYGKGEKSLILIPGLGFDASVFDDFVKANKKNYTMFVITIPGFGKTFIFSDKSSAMQLEKQIKKNGAQRYLERNNIDYSVN